ncbi:MAG: helix-turn-helix transcriptional regulator, partial [Clostridia bacterium]|nr:helix-turn-helix transcriptional regulator [Clostridia bacterium]
DYEVNARIRALRKKHKFTQEELGKMLGYKTSTYSQIERKGNIDTKLLKDLARIFDVDVKYILFGEIPEPKILTPEPSKPPEPQIIIGYKLKNETLSVMEMSFIEEIRRLGKEDISEIGDIIYKKLHKKT